MKLYRPPPLSGKYLFPVLQSGWLTSGPENERLIQALSEFLQVRPECIVLGSSATACFQAIVDHVKREYGHPLVEMTQATFVGMRQVVSLSCDFAKAHKPTLHVRTSIGGDRCDDPDWIEGAVRVRDACHSWLVDETADFTLFSMYPTKFVFGPEGGCVVCRSKREAERLRLHLYCGLVAGAAGSGRAPALCGRKANYPDTQAALAREALELSHRYMAEVALAHAHMAIFAREAGIPYRHQPLRPYLFQIEMDAERIPAAMEFLKTRGIASAWNFPPAGLLTVPCHSDLSDSDRAEIVSALRTFDREAPSRCQAPRPPASPLDPR